jgi:hypothetical protein
MGRYTILRALLVALVTTLAIIPGTALAASPEVFHDDFSDTFENVDVCGVNVDVVSEGVFTDKAFFDQDGNFVRFMSTISGTNTLTADNGKSVVVRFSNQFTDIDPIVDEAAGTITFVTTFIGLPEMIKTPHGPVLLREAGFISFAETRDLDTFDLISSEVIVKGPHPDADSDFTLFCEVITAALA